MRQRGIDSAFVRGTGPGGRIVEADVLLAAVMPKQTTKHSATVGSISPMRRAVATKVAESFA